MLVLANFVLSKSLGCKYFGIKMTIVVIIYYCHIEADDLATAWHRLKLDMYYRKKKKGRVIFSALVWKKYVIHIFLLADFTSSICIDSTARCPNICFQHFRCSHHWPILFTDQYFLILSLTTNSSLREGKRISETIRFSQTVYQFLCFELAFDGIFCFKSYL